MRRGKSSLSRLLVHRWRPSNFGGKLSASQLEYAALDAAFLLKLRVRLISKLQNARLLETAQIEFKAMPAVAQMELNGMLLDAKHWHLVAEELKAQKQTTLVELVKANLKPAPSAQLFLFPEMVESINPRSSVQVLSALQALNIPIKSTSKSEPIPLARQYPIMLERTLGSFVAQEKEDPTELPTGTRKSIQERELKAGRPFDDSTTAGIIAASYLDEVLRMAVDAAKGRPEEEYLKRLRALCEVLEVFNRPLAK
jgi:hypothetical protein